MQEKVADLLGNDVYLFKINKKYLDEIYDNINTNTIDLTGQPVKLIMLKNMRETDTTTTITSNNLNTKYDINKYQLNKVLNDKSKTDNEKIKMISEYLEERKSRFKNEEYENEPPLKRHFNKFIESNDLTSRYLDEKNKIQRQIRDWKIIIEEKEDRLDRKIERQRMRIEENELKDYIYLYKIRILYLQEFPKLKEIQKLNAKRQKVNHNIEKYEVEIEKLVNEKEKLINETKNNKFSSFMVNSLASGILNSIPGLESVNEIIEMNDEKLINDLYKLKNKILPKLRNELENTKKEYEEKSNTKNKNNDDDSNDDDSNDDILNKEKIENKSYIKNITDNYDEIKQTSLKDEQKEYNTQSRKPNKLPGSMKENFEYLNKIEENFKKQNNGKITFAGFVENIGNEIENNPTGIDYQLNEIKNYKDELKNNLDDTNISKNMLHIQEQTNDIQDVYKNVWELIEEWQHTKVDIDVENIDNDNEDKGGFNFKFPNLFKKSWSGIRQTQLQLQPSLQTQPALVPIQEQIGKTLKIGELEDRLGDVEKKQDDIKERLKDNEQKSNNNINEIKKLNKELENNLDVSWNNYLNTVKNNKEINNITNYLKEITIGNKIKSFTSWLVDAANKLQVEKLNDFVPETQEPTPYTSQYDFIEEQDKIISKNLNFSLQDINFIPEKFFGIQIGKNIPRDRVLKEEVKLPIGDLNNEPIQYKKFGIGIYPKIESYTKYDTNLGPTFQEKDLPSEPITKSRTLEIYGKIINSFQENNQKQIQIQIDKILQAYHSQITKGKIDDIPVNPENAKITLNDLTSVYWGEKDKGRQIQVLNNIPEYDGFLYYMQKYYPEDVIIPNTSHEKQFKNFMKLNDQQKQGNKKEITKIQLGMNYSGNFFTNKGILFRPSKEIQLVKNIQEYQNDDIHSNNEIKNEVHKLQYSGPIFESSVQVESYPTQKYYLDLIDIFDDFLQENSENTQKEIPELVKKIRLVRNEFILPEISNPIIKNKEYDLFSNIIGFSKTQFITNELDKKKKIKDYKDLILSLLENNEKINTSDDIQKFKKFNINWFNLDNYEQEKQLQPYTEGKYLSYDIGEMQINLNEDLEYRFLKMPFPEQKIPTFEPTEIERRLEPNVTFSTKEISYNETENIQLNSKVKYQIPTPETNQTIQYNNIKPFTIGESIGPYNDVVKNKLSEEPKNTKKSIQITYNRIIDFYWNNEKEKMKSEIIKLMTQYNDLFYTGEISNQELELSNKRFLDLSTQKTSGIKKLIQISNEDQFLKKLQETYPDDSILQITDLSSQYFTIKNFENIIDSNRIKDIGNYQTKMHFNGIFFTQEGIKYKPAKITKDLEFIIETQEQRDVPKLNKYTNKLLYEGPLFEYTLKYEQENNLNPEKRFLKLQKIINDQLNNNTEPKYDLIKLKEKLQISNDILMPKSIKDPIIKKYSEYLFEDTKKQYNTEKEIPKLKNYSYFIIKQLSKQISSKQLKMEIQKGIFELPFSRTEGIQIPYNNVESLDEDGLNKQIEQLIESKDIYFSPKKYTMLIEQVINQVSNIGISKDEIKKYTNDAISKLKQSLETKELDNKQINVDQVKQTIDLLLQFNIEIQNNNKVQQVNDLMNSFKLNILMSNFAGNKIIDEPITKRIFDYTSYIIKETNNNKLQEQTLKMSFDLWNAFHSNSIEYRPIKEHNIMNDITTKQISNGNTRELTKLKMNLQSSDLFIMKEIEYNPKKQYSKFFGEWSQQIEYNKYEKDITGYLYNRLENGRKIILKKLPELNNINEDFYFKKLKKSLNLNWSDKINRDYLKSSIDDYYYVLLEYLQINEIEDFKPKKRNPFYESFGNEIKEIEQQNQLMLDENLMENDIEVVEKNISRDLGNININFNKEYGETITEQINKSENEIEERTNKESNQTIQKILETFNQGQTIPGVQNISRELLTTSKFQIDSGIGNLKIGNLSDLQNQQNTGQYSFYKNQNQLNIGRFTQTTIPPIDIKSPEVLIKYFKGIPDENTNTQVFGKYLDIVQDWASGKFGRFTEKYYPKIFNRKIKRKLQYRAWQQFLGTEEYYKLSPMNQVRVYVKSYGGFQKFMSAISIDIQIDSLFAFFYSQNYPDNISGDQYLQQLITGSTNIYLKNGTSMMKEQDGFLQKILIGIGIAGDMQNIMNKSIVQYQLSVILLTQIGFQGAQLGIIPLLIGVQQGIIQALGQDLVLRMITNTKVYIKNIFNKIFGLESIKFSDELLQTYIKNTSKEIENYNNNGIFKLSEQISGIIHGIFQSAGNSTSFPFSNLIQMNLLIQCQQNLQDKIINNYSFKDLIDNQIDFIGFYDDSIGNYGQMTKINIEGTTKQLVGKFEDKLILKELFTGIKETKYYKDNIKLDQQSIKSFLESNKDNVFNILYDDTLVVLNFLSNFQIFFNHDLIPYKFLVKSTINENSNKSMNDIEQLITNGNEYNDIIDIVEKYIENNPEQEYLDDETQNKINQKIKDALSFQNILENKYSNIQNKNRLHYDILTEYIFKGKITKEFVNNEQQQVTKFLNSYDSYINNYFNVNNNNQYKTIKSLIPGYYKQLNNYFIPQYENISRQIITLFSAIMKYNMNYNQDSLMNKQITSIDDVDLNIYSYSEDEKQLIYYIKNNEKNIINFFYDQYNQSEQTKIIQQITGVEIKVTREGFITLIKKIKNQDLNFIKNNEEFEFLDTQILNDETILDFNTDVTSDSKTSIQGENNLPFSLDVVNNIQGQNEEQLNLNQTNTNNNSNTYEEQLNLNQTNTNNNSNTYEEYYDILNNLSEKYQGELFGLVLEEKDKKDYIKIIDEYNSLFPDDTIDINNPGIYNLFFNESIEKINKNFKQKFGFRTGGYTPDIGDNKQVGIVHGGEWVAPQWMVEDEDFKDTIEKLEQKRNEISGENNKNEYKDGGIVVDKEIKSFELESPLLNTNKENNNNNKVLQPEIKINGEEINEYDENIKYWKLQNEIQNDLIFNKIINNIESINISNIEDFNKFYDNNILDNNYIKIIIQSQKMYKNDLKQKEEYINNNKENLNDIDLFKWEIDIQLSKIKFHLQNFKIQFNKKLNLVKSKDEKLEYFLNESIKWLKEYANKYIYIPSGINKNENKIETYKIINTQTDFKIENIINNKTSIQNEEIYDIEIIQENEENLHKQFTTNQNEETENENITQRNKPEYSKQTDLDEAYDNNEENNQIIQNEETENNPVEINNKKNIYSVKNVTNEEEKIKYSKELLIESLNYFIKNVKESFISQIKQYNKIKNFQDFKNYLNTSWKNKMLLEQQIKSFNQGIKMKQVEIDKQKNDKERMLLEIGQKELELRIICYCLYLDVFNIKENDNIEKYLKDKLKYAKNKIINILKSIFIVQNDYVLKMDDLEYSFEEYTKETENDTKTIEEQIIPEIQTDFEQNEETENDTKTIEEQIIPEIQTDFEQNEETENENITQRNKPEYSKQTDLDEAYDNNEENNQIIQNEETENDTKTIEEQILGYNQEKSIFNMLLKQMEVEGKETENTIFDVIVNPNKYFGESDDIYGTKEMKNQFGKVLVDFGVNKLTQQDLGITEEMMDAIIGDITPNDDKDFNKGIPQQDLGITNNTKTPDIDQGVNKLTQQDLGITEKMFENNIPPDKKESKNEYNEEFYKNTIQLFDVLYNDVEYLKKQLNKLSSKIINNETKKEEEPVTD